jgi:hypothetical protein
VIALRRNDLRTSNETGEMETSLQASNGRSRAFSPPPRSRLSVGLLTVIASVALLAGPAQAQDGSPDVRVIATRDTSIVAGTGSYRIRLVSASPVHVTVTVERPGGQAREILSQMVSDVSELGWDGLDENGNVVEGAAALRFDLRSPEGRTDRLDLPLTIRTTGGDTVPHPGLPADTARILKRASTLPSIATLAAGLLAGAAAVALPSAVARDGRGAPVRFAIGGTLGLTGVLGFFAQREQQIDEEAMERNRLTREAWSAALGATIEENRERRLVQLHIVAGEVISGRLP